MDSDGRRWAVPALVVLSRGTQAETVLSFCKLFTPLGGGGVNTANTGCWVTTCNTACLQHSMSS